MSGGTWRRKDIPPAPLQKCNDFECQNYFAPTRGFKYCPDHRMAQGRRDGMAKCAHSDCEKPFKVGRGRKYCDEHQPQPHIAKAAFRRCTYCDQPVFRVSPRGAFPRIHPECYKDKAKGRAKKRYEQRALNAAQYRQLLKERMIAPPNVVEIASHPDYLAPAHDEDRVTPGSFCARCCDITDRRDKPKCKRCGMPWAEEVVARGPITTMSSSAGW